MFLVIYDPVTLLENSGELREMSQGGLFYRVGVLKSAKYGQSMKEGSFNIQLCFERCRITYCLKETSSIQTGKTYLNFSNSVLNLVLLKEVPLPI